MRVIPSLLILLSLPLLLTAQQVEHVYPDYDHNSLFGAVVTDNGDFYAAGSNSTLLRSTDDGFSWEQVPMNGHCLHIHKLVSDGTDLYLLTYAVSYTHLRAHET